MNKVQNRSAYHLEDLDLLGDSLSFSLVYHTPCMCVNRVYVCVLFNIRNSI